MKGVWWKKTLLSFYNASLTKLEGDEKFAGDGRPVSLEAMLEMITVGKNIG